MRVVWCISAKENYCNLRKIALNFRRVSLKGVLLLVGVLECFGKTFKSTCEKVESLKSFTANKLLHKWFLRLPVGFFFHLFTYPLIYSSLIVSYIAHISCICIHICKRYYFPYLLFLRRKAKKKKILNFGSKIWILIWSIYLILCYHLIHLFNYFLHICHLLALSFRRRQSETFLLLKYFYSRELEHISFQANVLLI